LIENYYLQAEAGVSFLVAIIVAFLICIIFYIVQKRTMSNVKKNLGQISTDVTNMKTSMPHYNEVS